ncbi:hypothetical protein DAI22_01g455001 [Oryza sativa Japonica Group]|nr:hypothetical protein DAI22_01g455001 [Oryza sativa Japonica Group]
MSISAASAHTRASKQNTMGRGARDHGETSRSTSRALSRHRHTGQQEPAAGRVGWVRGAPLTWLSSAGLGDGELDVAGVGYWDGSICFCFVFLNLWKLRPTPTLSRSPHLTCEVENHVLLPLVLPRCSSVVHIFLIS